MKISVIVPMYNVEKYLEECIKSIINQTFTNLEIILVDDGSPDNCGIIADNYMQQDDRIKVIHQNNQGLSAARNAGLQVASGEYVAFVDSDDFLDKNMYKVMAEQIKQNEDIVICSYDRVDESSMLVSKKKHFDSFYFCEQEELNNCVCCLLGCKCLDDWNNYFADLFILPWNKLYRRQFIVQNNLKYDIQFRAHEDTWFNYNVFKCAETVIGLDYVGYHFRINSASITNAFKKNRLELNYQLISNIYIDNYDILFQKKDNKMKQTILAFFTLCFIGDLDQYICHSCNDINRYERIQQIKERATLIEYKKAFSEVSFSFLTTGQKIYTILYRLKMWNTMVILTKIRLKRKKC
ncbi:MAG: glycosyltransferase [Lachnospiraceae bacterium]|nr:glycosyltransferase [Lachnospiraceae bacterium]